MGERILIAFFLMAFIILTGCTKKNEYKNLNCSSEEITYTSSIKSIIETNCTGSGCHGTGTSNGNYTTYEGLLVRVNNGTLSKRVLYTKDMPKGSSLSLEDRKKIKCWIDRGAPKE